MPGRTRKYSARTDGELKIRVLAVLDSADDSIMPTIDWIRQQDMILTPYSTQKLSRILGSLVDIGLVRKGKSKSLGRMIYRLTSKMREAGYDIEDETGFGAPTRAWNGLEWDIEDEMKEEEE